MSRFIVATFTVTDKNQFKGRNINLPPTVSEIKSITVVTNDIIGKLRTTRRYIGVGAVGAFNQAFVLELSVCDYIKSKIGTYQFSPAPGQYIFMAWPKRLGKAKFEINGDSLSMENPLVINITDPTTGFAEDYYFWKSVDDGDSTSKTITIS